MLTFRIKCQAMSHVELAGLFTLPSPGLDEFTGLVELQDSRVAVCSRRVALSDEDVAVARDGDVVGFIQQLRRTVPFAALPLVTKRHHDLAFGADPHVRMCTHVR